MTASARIGHPDASASGNFAIASGTPTHHGRGPGRDRRATTLGASASVQHQAAFYCWDGEQRDLFLHRPTALISFAADLDACSNLVGSPARCGLPAIASTPRWRVRT